MLSAIQVSTLEEETQLLGLFSFMFICVLHFKYNKFLSTDLDNKLLLFLILTGSGFASVLFGPFTANCFRYLWPYSQGALLVFLFVIPLFARIKENKSQENSLINVSSTDKKHKKLLKNSSLSPLGLRHSPKGTLNKSV